MVVSCELVCVCVSLTRAVIICLASTHNALVSSPSLTVLHLPTYLPAALQVLQVPLLLVLLPKLSGADWAVEGGEAALAAALSAAKERRAATAAAMAKAADARMAADAARRS